MSELTPIKDIMQQFLEDLKSGKAAEDFRHDENTYRRGYHQGYSQAVDDICRLLDDGMYSRDARALVCLQSNLVGIWRTERLDEFIAPPHLNKMSLLETLEYRRNLRMEE